jgi:hypothetical protein
MANSAAIQPSTLPIVSYSPFRLIEAVPWLMLASALRMLQAQGGLMWLIAGVCSDLAVFLAFLLVARRMIELANGQTALGRLTFTQQLSLAWKVVLPITAMIVIVSTLTFAAGAKWIGLNLLFGFDGIAFDQWTRPGMVWSAFLAAITLLMLLKAENTGKANLFECLRELWRRSPCIVPAIVTITIANAGLGIAQGLVRGLVYAYWHNSAAPSLIRVLVIFFFVFSFASIRLWATLAILTFALRESYRRDTSCRFGQKIS